MDGFSTPQSHKRVLDSTTPLDSQKLFAPNDGNSSRAKKTQRMDPERLNDILEDFDAEGKHYDTFYNALLVEARTQKIRINAKLCANRLKRDLDIQLTGMNTIIRKMTVKEFREKYNEDMDLVQQAESNDLLFTKNQILSRISSIQTSTATMTTPRKQAPAPPSVHQTFAFKTPSKTPKKIVYATPNNTAVTQPIPTTLRSRRKKVVGQDDSASLNKENVTLPSKGSEFSLLIGSNKINICSPNAKQKVTQDPSAIQEILRLQAQLQSILSSVNTSTIN
jgi:hypothetical protein